MFRFLFIIVLFGAALASGTWGMRAYREHLAETEAQESTDAVEEIEFETFSVANLLKEQPAEDSAVELVDFCLLYTSPSPRDRTRSRMPSSA